MCTNDKGRIDFFRTNPCLQGPSLIYPVSNRKLPWVQMRRGTGSHTKSNPDFCSSWFWFPNIPIPCVSPIKLHNRSELRADQQPEYSQETKPRDHAGGKRKGSKLDAGWLPGPQRSTLMLSCLGPGRKAQLPRSLDLAGNLTPDWKTALKCSTVFFGTGKQKSSSLEKWAAANGNIPFNYAFLTLLNNKALESRHNDSFLRHDTLKCGWFGVFRGDQRKDGGKNDKSASSTCCCWWRLLLLNYIYRNLQDKLKSKRF